MSHILEFLNLTPKMFFPPDFSFFRGERTLPLATALPLRGSGQRCRSVFNIGGYNSAFLPFFRDFEILGGGGYSGFADFSSFNDFENLLKQLKTRIRMHKINK